MVTSLLVTNSANALIVTNAEKIMQRSKHAHLIKIYINDTYLDVYSTKSATVSLEVLAPNGTRETTILTPEDNSGKDNYLVYYYYLESKMTTGAGDLELGMNIIYTSADTGEQVVRSISTCKLAITPVEAWVVTATDENLTNLQNALADMNTIAQAIISGNAGSSTVSDIAVGSDDNGYANLHLVNAAGTQIGSGIQVTDDQADRDDGTLDSIIDLSKLTTSGTSTSGGTGNG